MTELTEDIIRDIKYRFEHGQRVGTIAKYLNLSEWKVRKTVDPEWFEKQRQLRRDRPKSPTYKGNIRSFDSLYNHPLYDPRRDGVQYHPTISGQLFGDPPPGRSALDERNKSKQVP